MATVLRELAERLDAHALVRAAEVEGEQVYGQGLDSLLDRIGRADLSAPLAEWLRTRAPHVAPFRPDRPITGTPRDARWRVAISAEVEIEGAADRSSGWSVAAST